MHSDEHHHAGGGGDDEHHHDHHDADDQLLHADELVDDIEAHDLNLNLNLNFTLTQAVGIVLRYLDQLVEHDSGADRDQPGRGSVVARRPAEEPAQEEEDDQTTSTTPDSNLPTGKGVPTATNPTFSLSLPGPAPIGVPNFFIDSFRIPPFLIPIYQAAGIEYQIPWQVLAGINEIETDYGRNLSVSSAGAVGWMQFLPSTWKEWGVDANGDGVADPYNPVDAIFTAARYLHAAGASSNLTNAIFAYNHASWYVRVGAPAGQADRRHPVSADRRAHRPGPGALPGRRPGQVRRLVGRQARQEEGQDVQRLDRHRLQPQRQGNVDLRQEGVSP